MTTPITGINDVLAIVATEAGPAIFNAVETGIKLGIRMSADTLEQLAAHPEMSADQHAVLTGAVSAMRTIATEYKLELPR